ncbi:agrin [Tetranychus urticae]|uniref:agrin n=1 Tax=Tetranychus urticae TaxID=32264 RepID=UPI00077BC856|nr:agrin [Tetranychus urticae]
MQSTVLAALFGFLLQSLLSQQISFQIKNQQTNCPKQCNQHSPVCASDGKMYRSKCQMEMENCGKNVTVVDLNYCMGESSCPEFCLEIYDPVCGDDDRMYSNKCLMLKMNCGKKKVKAVNKSFCIESARRSSRRLEHCPKHCLLVDRPVCGSDLQLYRNECVMRQKNCGKKLSVVDMKECVQQPNPCPTRCVTIPDPVCGSDGKWYLNKCWFLMQNCGKSIARASDELCPRNLLPLIFNKSN